MKFRVTEIALDSVMRMSVAPSLIFFFGSSVLGHAITHTILDSPDSTHATLSLGMHVHTSTANVIGFPRYYSPVQK
jgi:hypothetical protein